MALDQNSECIPCSLLRGYRANLKSDKNLNGGRYPAACRRVFNHYLDLRTYKRNRSVIIVKITEEDLMVIENGFFKDRFQIKAAKLRKLLKSLLKKEFPRSRKIRLYEKGEFNEDEASD